MKISGFTFVKNGVMLDYPFLESIQSILPICDELVIAVGDSSDNTRDLIIGLNNPKIKIVDTIWDPEIKTGGQILAQQTNIAKSYISGDWGFYIQADEVVHEKYYSEILRAASENLHNPEVEGLLFGFRHFYGSYNFYGISRDWYRHEIRMIKNYSYITSYKDAQGFRSSNNKKLKVRALDAEIFHYGWVRSPEAQKAKRKLVSPLWGEESEELTAFHYKRREKLKTFLGTHPNVMLKRVENMNWKFPYDPNKTRMSVKEKLSQWIEGKTGLRIAEYKNYVITK